MLQIIIPISPEGWDEKKQEFVKPEEKTLELEHSLVSLSKWESKWCKPFFYKKDKTDEEVLDYIRCMTITRNVHPDVYNHLTVENVKAVKEYIEHPMSATTVPCSKSGRNSRETVTSELIYYWMITLGVPVEFEKWHINRLLKLIEVCSYKNSDPKNRNRREIAQDYAAMNAARRQKLNTKG